VAPRLQVVERIEHEVEAAEPLDAELGVFDVCMMGDNLNCAVELLGDLLGDLMTVQLATIPVLRRETDPYQCLRFLDVLLTEQKLPIEIAEVDCIEVDDVDLPKAGKDEVLE